MAYPVLESSKCTSGIRGEGILRYSGAPGSTRAAPRSVAQAAQRAMRALLSSGATAGAISIENEQATKKAADIATGSVPRDERPRGVSTEQWPSR